MWCTRWFLPLLLLPLPTAPPYFLILFLLSLTMHAKPCFYCIVLLTTLFISSCYWQPFPIDSPLTTPWADNITTFSDALNATLSSNYTKPLPPVMRAADRCWCDFSGGGLFEPFNVSRWEYNSVRRLSRELIRQAKAVEKANQDTQQESPQSSISTEIPTPTPTRATLNPENVWWRLFHRPTPSTSSADPTINHPVTAMSTQQPATMTEQRTQVVSTPESTTQLPLLRKQYDLRRYGVGLIIDWSWST
ncbi:unnamed protein product [Cyclocybe aegerita]|uniref:Uncharacterized protein n=1 Tax=Cyclocybe aegerita TaxID=1973307 RepID=A0A8S0WE34_CYCAE|nr:unnamed protein product [Cyclocybe aegerita]